MIKNKKTIIYLLIIIVFLLLSFFLFSKIIQSPEISYDNQTELEAEELMIAEEEKEEEKEPIRFLFFGDLMLDRHVRELISRHGVDHIFSLLNEKEFSKDYDYVFANLEGAVTDGGKHYLPEMLYDFAFEPETVARLKDYNFNIFTVSNNHLADQGARGIKETYQNLSDLGFYYFGCKDGYLSDNKEPVNFLKNKTILREDNCSYIITETKGKKIAWLGFSIVYQAIDEGKILDTIESLKQESDFLIVSPHWGIEYQEIASQSQRNLAKSMVEAGADLIIGHHPHVIQDYTKHEDVYIFYSLGNFIFDQYFSEETQVGLAVSIKLYSDGQIEKELYEVETNLSRIENIIKINE